MSDSWQDPVLSAGDVLRLVRQHVPAAANLTAVDESGRKGRAYLVDGDIVLKAHRPRRLRGRLVEEFETSLEKEAFFLQKMNRQGLDVPRMLGYGRDGAVEYVCMSRIQGRSLRAGSGGAQARGDALVALGETLARIHSMPQEELLGSGLFPVDRTAGEVRSRMAALFARVATAADALSEEWRLSLDAREVAKRALDFLPASIEPVALHSNPAPEHVFVDPATGRFSGLIDFADAYISHPAFDLRPWRVPPERELVLRGYTRVRPITGDFLGAMRAAMLLGEMANVLRMRRSPAEAEAVIGELLTEGE